MSDQDATEGGPELTVVIPTLDERDNIQPLYDRLCAVLNGTVWEAIVVDDDSTDGTTDAVRKLAQRDRRVRLLHRLGRRGLSSACVEGIQASTSPFVAVMDADLQHDETLLLPMLNVLRSEPVDVVVGSRYLVQGGVGDWSAKRAQLSGIATRLGGFLLRVPMSDPMSGFFMFRREAFREAIRRVSTIGYKVLIDLLASSPKPPRIKELPYHFRSRRSGESKFDTFIGLEFIVLLIDKSIGRILPLGLVLFGLIGAIGILTHVAMLMLFLKGLQLSFAASQIAATLFAMIGNFALNNWLNYRDMRLSGWNWVKGLILFCLICSVGAAANIGIASFLFSEQHSAWWVAGIAGAAMSLVWNYTMTSIVIWRRRF